MSRRHSTVWKVGKLPRPEGGPRFHLEGHPDIPASGKAGWRSNGGASRTHPARAFPFSLEVPIPDGILHRVHLLGVFAMFAGPEYEATGALGASVQLTAGSEIVFRHELLNGQHYLDALDLNWIDDVIGDGSSLKTLGQSEIDDQLVRVDLLTIDVLEGTKASSLWFKDLGGPSSFVLFDVFFETAEPEGCPFSAKTGGVPLSEIGPIIRIADRVRFIKALDQFEKSMALAGDLDEARGQALTFLAVVTAAMLEQGGSIELHREQLNAAREVEHLTSATEVSEFIHRRVEEVARPLFQEAEGPSSYLVNRALSLVERNFAKDLNDATVAAQLGLSTSHFRFLFRQATGQPFHKYLVALRLEKARRMLVEDDVSVSAVARAVGFAGLSHFSRAFAQRFGISPTSVRRTVQ